jgi:Uma2 family endonuclease
MSMQSSLADVIYPESDGRPMGETDLHRDWMFRIIDILKTRFAGQKVYVTGNLLMYYEPGNFLKHLSPDAMVVKGRPPGRRRVYKVWEEGPPDFVLETTSASTRKEDLIEKRTKYAAIGVREYFLFDPTGDWLPDQLRAYTLVAGSYRQIVAREGQLRSAELDLVLRIDADGGLEFLDPVSGGVLMTAAEGARDRADRAEARAEASEAGRAAAEARAAALEAELARLKEGRQPDLGRTSGPAGS